MGQKREVVGSYIHAKGTEPRLVLSSGKAAWYTLLQTGLTTPWAVAESRLALSIMQMTFFEPKYRPDRVLS